MTSQLKDPHHVEVSPEEREETFHNQQTHQKESESDVVEACVSVSTKQVQFCIALPLAKHHVWLEQSL